MYQNFVNNYFAGVKEFFLQKVFTSGKFHSGMKKYLVSELAKKFNRTRPAIMGWIEQGLFPGASLNEEGIVPFWEVPESDLKGFDPPKRGRRKKAKNPQQEKNAA